MQIHLIAVGTRMPDWVENGFEEYRKRLAGDMKLQLHELAMPKRNTAPVEKLIAQEAELVRRKLEKLPGTHTIALEVTGKSYTTEKLARHLQGHRDQGQDLAILVGGPDGLCPRLSSQCQERWSLSSLTLPHPLVRIMLAEQIYRCWSLMAGHPYHR